MSRVVKLAAAAAFGGLLVAAAVVSSNQPPSSAGTELSVQEQTTPTDPDAAQLRRCRTIAVPDPQCDAAWEAERQRFFHGRDHQP